MIALISVIGLLFSSAQNQKPGPCQICKYHVGLSPGTLFFFYEETDKNKNKKGEEVKARWLLGRTKLSFLARDALLKESNSKTGQSGPGHGRAGLRVLCRKFRFTWETTKSRNALGLGFNFFKLFRVGFFFFSFKNVFTDWFQACLPKFLGGLHKF